MVLCVLIGMQAVRLSGNLICCWLKMVNFRRPSDLMTHQQ